MRTRNGDEIGGETKKQKISSDNRDIAGKLVENYPAYVVTSNQHPRETRQALKVHQHGDMKYFIDVEERGITANSAAVLSTLMARNIEKKISTEAMFPCGALESEAARQDVEAALNEGMMTQVSIDDMQLFVCEVIVKILEEEYMEEINESAPNSFEPESRDELAWNDVNNCKLDPARLREARMADTEYFQKMQVHKKVSVQPCKDETGKMPNKVRWIETNKQDEGNPKYRSRLVAKEFKRYHDPDLFSSTLPIEMLIYTVSNAATGK